MAELRELYQDLILDHYKNPRNLHRLEYPNRKADGLNPLCGDKFSVYLAIEEGRICDIAFEGAGCAISMASASMMTVILKGKSEKEALAIHNAFLQLLSSRSEVPPGIDLLGELAVFSSVRDYPVRVKCATLAWHALRAALDRQADTVSTE